MISSRKEPEKWHSRDLGPKGLRGLRSARVDRNFRVIFLIPKEFRARRPDLSHLLDTLDDIPEDAVVFLAIGPHGLAYGYEF